MREDFGEGDLEAHFEESACFIEYARQLGVAIILDFVSTSTGK